MSNYSEKDKDFLDAVWCKVRYLEYIKLEQEKVKENNIRLAAARVKLASVLAVAVSILSVPMMVINGLALETVLGIGVLLLGSGAIYEFYSEQEKNRRVTYGNKH